MVICRNPRFATHKRRRAMPLNRTYRAFSRETTLVLQDLQGQIAIKQTRDEAVKIAVTSNSADRDIADRIRADYVGNIIRVYGPERDTFLLPKIDENAPVAMMSDAMRYFENAFDQKDDTEAKNNDQDADGSSILITIAIPRWMRFEINNLVFEP